MKMVLLVQALGVLLTLISGAQDVELSELLAQLKTGASQRGASLGAEADIVDRIEACIISIQMRFRNLDANGVNQAARQLSDFGVPARITSIVEAMRARASIIAEIVQRKQQQALTSDVNTFVDDVRAKCLAARESKDLEPYMDEFRVQNQKLLNNGISTGDRRMERVQTARKALEKWLAYHDYKAAGDTANANEQLRSLSSIGRASSTIFPLFTDDEIKEHLIAEPKALSIADLFKAPPSADQLDAAIKLVEHAINSKMPVVKPDPQWSSTLDQLKALRDASNFANASRFDEGLYVLQQRLKPSIRSFEGAPHYAIYLSLLETMIEQSAKIACGISRAPAEDLKAYVDRSLRASLEHEKFESLLALVALKSSLLPAGAATYGVFNSEERSLRQYVTGKQLEAANDIFPAILAYRAVVSSYPTPLSLVEKAQQDLKRLHEKYPKLFDNVESAIATEVAGLRAELSRIKESLSGGMDPRLRMMPSPYTR